MKWTRRDVLKGLGGLPILGTVWWAGTANALVKSKDRSEILEQLKIQPSLPTALPQYRRCTNPSRYHRIRNKGRTALQGFRFCNTGLA